MVSIISPVISFPDMCTLGFMLSGPEIQYCVHLFQDTFSFNFTFRNTWAHIYPEHTQHRHFLSFLLTGPSVEDAALLISSQWCMTHHAGGSGKRENQQYSWHYPYLNHWGSSCHEVFHGFCFLKCCISILMSLGAPLNFTPKAKTSPSSSLVLLRQR